MTTIWPDETKMFDEPVILPGFFVATTNPIAKEQLYKDVLAGYPDKYYYTLSLLRKIGTLTAYLGDSDSLESEICVCQKFGLGLFLRWDPFKHLSNTNNHRPITTEDLPANWYSATIDLRNIIRRCQETGIPVRGILLNIEPSRPLPSNVEVWITMIDLITYSIEEAAQELNVPNFLIIHAHRGQRRTPDSLPFWKVPLGTYGHARCCALYDQESTRCLMVLSSTMTGLSDFCAQRTVPIISVDGGWTYITKPRKFMKIPDRDMIPRFEDIAKDINNVSENIPAVLIYAPSNRMDATFYTMEQTWTESAIALVEKLQKT